MKSLILIILTVAAVAATWHFQPPIAQDLAYHQFVDQRAMYGIDNFWNVASNGLILLVGLLGFIRSCRMTDMHLYADLRREFGVLFTAVILTAAGSAWYHLSPSNASLFWDRLPMSILFMSLLGIVITMYISELGGKALFWPLVAIGAGSILYWHRTEMAGAGDLRPWILVQGLSAFLVLLIIILYRKPQRPTGLLLISLVFYGIAKAAEHFDAMAYHYTSSLVSGHSIKHIAAGLALFMVYLILRRKHA